MLIRVLRSLIIILATVYRMFPNEMYPFATETRKVARLAFVKRLKDRELLISTVNYKTYFPGRQDTFKKIFVYKNLKKKTEIIIRKKPPCHNFYSVTKKWTLTVKVLSRQAFTRRRDRKMYHRR